MVPQTEPYPADSAPEVGRLSRAAAARGFLYFGELPKDGQIDRLRRAVAVAHVRRSASKRVADCGKANTVVRCPSCGKAETYAVPIRCRSRLCRHCARVRSMQWLAKMKGVRFTWPMLLTLTLRPGSDVAALLSLALKSFRILRRAVPALARGLYAVEVNENAAGWYVHIHALVDCRWVYAGKVQAIWQQLTGASVLDVRRVKQHGFTGALLEVVKYVTKPTGSDSPLTAEQIDELGAAIHGRRLVATWGLSLNSILQETTAQRLVCPKCSTRLVHIGFVDADCCDVPLFDFSARSRAAPPQQLPVPCAN